MEVKILLGDENCQKSPQLNITLIPTGYIFCLMAMDCWGRRPILSFCQAISGLACIAAGLLFPLTETNPGIGGLQVHGPTTGKIT